MPGVLAVRAGLLEKERLPNDAFLPSALQKQGQQMMRQSWQTGEEGHTWGPSFQPLLQRRA